MLDLQPNWNILSCDNDIIAYLYPMIVVKHMLVGFVLGKIITGRFDCASFLNILIFFYFYKKKTIRNQIMRDTAKWNSTETKFLFENTVCPVIFIGDIVPIFKCC